MNEFTEKDRGIVMEALNFLLKNQQNALEMAAVIIPVAVKVQNMKIVQEIENDK